MIEIIAVAASLLCVLLTVYKNKLCWPVGIIGILGYMWIFYQNGHIGNATLQLVFLGQSLLGWYNWHYNVKKEFKFVDKIMSNVNFKKTLKYSLILNVILLFLLFYGGGADPVLDSISTALSLTGMLLLAYKKYQAWYLWIMANIIYIIMFALNGELLLMSNYIIFLGLAIWGLFKWKKDV